MPSPASSFAADLSSTYAATLDLFATPATLLASQTPWLPPTNAALNATSALLVTLGFFAIKRGQIETHARLMCGAILASSLFLIGYLVNLGINGTTKFPHEGGVRTLYFAILLSHTLLAMSVPPLVGATVYFAWKGRLAKHKRLAKWTLPIWAYVSVTGVVIYAMLHHL